jgi:hypothetical protein
LAESAWKYELSAAAKFAAAATLQFSDSAQFVLALPDGGKKRNSF